MKTLTFTLLLSIVCFSAFSRDWSVGPRLGANISNYVTENHGSLVDYKVGFQVGGFVMYPLNERVNLVGELLFANRGDYFYEVDIQRFTNDEGRPLGTSTQIDRTHQHLNYLDVPLMVRFLKGFGILAGIQPSVLLYAKYDYYGTYEDNFGSQNRYEVSDFSENNSEDYKKFDLAMLFGFEHQLKFGLNYGLRASYGLLPVVKESDLNTNNISFQFMLGWKL